ncbi:restriction endonuclease subunit S [Phocaeicola dorei]|jgi:type I restriction enzyme S subunit|uniref:Restriction endonuclease subunit S n=5 Tax=Bacteroidia TaxID=200643 RepID=A0A412ZKD7_9BACT|nr:restriction endonuclease subunit S [Phocaeicola dorei]MCG4635997.1 restriction endonuclease subunit S [Phocaeicola dorei]MDU0272363.1 restriction endonuclease subunit S [Phocaeicola dorei]RGV81522.1 type I restriction endonuclease [Phocaeicola dorei]WHX09377.1 restriction endonuclease subunit S [Phocaeicola dorei]
MDTKALRQKILDLAIHGKLVPQDPNDEPASVLLERIKAEKERLIKEGKIKRSKKSAKTSDTPHYENVPFEVPESWVWCRLDDIVCELKYGTSEKSSSVGKIAVLRMGNITNVGTIDYSNLVYSSNDEDIEQYSLEKNDLLFNRTNSSEWVGKTAIYKEEQPAIYAGYLIRIKPLLISPDYLNTVMNSGYYRDWCYDVKTDAVNQSNINAQKLSQLMIPIPPLKEQERIVAEMDKWISLIDIVKNGKGDLLTVIKQAKSKILDLAIHGKLVPQDPNDEPAIELLKRINPDFTPCDNGHYTFDVPNGWNWCKLNDLCSFLSRGKSPKYSEDDKTYPVFAQKCNLKEGGISLEQARFLDPSTINKWDSKYKLQTGDVLVNSTGTGTVGRTRLFDESYLGKYPFVVPDSHVAVVRTYEEINSEYVFAYMSSQLIQQYIEDNLAGSTNQKELYIGVLENLYFPFPPINEQQRIVQKIEELFSVLDNIQNALEV